ncbi:MAG: hypothetical protein KJ621_19255 [Proteobacteria bacterium]|nr:hypothetical protein [Pseudomonadota bacterium]MBU1740713.1 hypothetical protein [Pseudomonadota bacterium]
MKRWLILGLAVGLLVAFTVPAGAKMILLGTNQNGAFYVIDRVFNKVGDCSDVPTLILMRGLKKTPYGMVKAVARTMRVCCQARTYQVVAYSYLGADRKPLYTRKIPEAMAKVMKAKPETMGYILIQKVCAPGFPGN